MRYLNEFTKGIIKENPIFVMMLGLCPALAVSTKAINGIGMGIAFTFVLLGSNIIISAVRNIVPDKIRIPCYIIVIATFVTIVDLSMQAFAPLLSKELGIFVPLIVVNCIVMGRAEAFASKNNILASALDALGVGIGFTLILTLIATIREFLGAGSITFSLFGIGFEYSIEKMNPMIIMILPPGAFITIGLLMGFKNWLQNKTKNL